LLRKGEETQRSRSKGVWEIGFLEVYKDCSIKDIKEESGMLELLDMDLKGRVREGLMMIKDGIRRISGWVGMKHCEGAAS